MKVYVVIHDDGMTYENDHHIDMIFRKKKDADDRANRMNKLSTSGVEYEVEEHDLV